MVLSALLCLLLIPPLSGTTTLTSSFGEYRATHLHGGVDYSTGGKVGRFVHATSNGTIRTIRITWRGYGKVLYLEHGDGWTSVYAHLDAFAPAIRTQIAPILKSKGPFPGWIDLPRPVRVKRGEVIGTSGETGEGLPHLHYELRHDNHPVDPLAHLPAAAAAHTFLSRITLLPASTEARIEGSVYPLTIALPARKTLHVSGPFSLCVTGGRRAGRYVWGVTSLSLRVDGKERAVMKMEEINYDWFTAIGFLFCRSSMEKHPVPAAYWLTPPGGNPLPILHGPSSLNLPAGRHTLTVLSGKRSESVKIVVEGPESTNRVRGPTRFLLTHYIAAGRPKNYPTVPAALSDTPPAVGGCVAAGEKVTLAPFSLVHSEPHSLPLVLQLASDPPAVSSPLLSPVIRVGPEDLPLTRRLKLTFQPRGKVDERRVDIYRWRRKWRRVGAQWRDDVLTGESRIPGIYAVILDETPPVIGKVTIRGKEIAVAVKDDLSDLDWNGVVITSGGKESVLIYDPDRHVAQGPFPGRPYTITASDRAGNESHYRHHPK